MAGDSWSRSGEFKFVWELTDAAGKVLGKNVFRQSKWGSREGEGAGWGLSQGIKRDVFTNLDIVATNFVTLTCTVLASPYPPEPPAPPKIPPFSDNLRTAHESMFNLSSAADVAFTFLDKLGQPDERVLVANKDFLQKRAPYFETMFSGGFSEGESVARPLKRLKLDKDSSAAFYPDDDDDDTVEWLPDELLQRSDNFEPMEAVAGEEPTDAAEQDKTRQQIQITDAGYITYRAMLYWLYSEKITFTPLASSYTVAHHATEARTAEAGSEASSTAATRRQFLLSAAPKHDNPVDAASPHAIYRLADKLDLPELKSEAKEAIIEGFAVNNILYELVSTFSYHYDEIQQAALQYAWKNWDAVKETPSFDRVFAGASEIEGGPAILGKLVKGTTVAGQAKA
ncbi:hypothetical protein JCM10207_002980 [Rhodosporidiobolus poonsookiae]